MKCECATLVENIDEVNPAYSERNLAQCHFVHHKSQMDWPNILMFNRPPPPNIFSPK
jgi:hypothetical protein